MKPLAELTFLSLKPLLQLPAHTRIISDLPSLPPSLYLGLLFMALSVSSKVHKGSFQRLSSRRHTRSAFPTLSPLGRGHAGGLIYPSAGRSDRKSDLVLSLGSSADICRFSPLLAILYYHIHVWMHNTDLLESNPSPPNSTPHLDTSTSSSEGTLASKSITVFDHPPHTDSGPSQEVNMLSTQHPSAIGGHFFSGHGQGKNPASITMDLQTLRSSPILNPHFKMIQR